MVEIILKGISLGLLIALLVGPVFFLLIEVSLNKGFVQALFLAIGIALSDTTFIVLIYSGLAQFSENSTFTRYMGVGGGVILTIFGLFMMFKKAKENKSIEIQIEKKQRFKYFLKGFILNTLNPSVLFFWVGSVGLISTELGYQTKSVFLFFSCTIGTVFLTDLLKIQLAKRLLKATKPIIIQRFSQFSGLMMVAYGLKLLFNL